MGASAERSLIVVEERAREARADLERAPRRDAGDPATSRPTEVGRALAHRARRAGEGGASRPRTRPETGRAAQPRRREVDGEAEVVAGAGDAKRRALPASGSPWTGEGRGRRSRTGPRGPRAGGARARRVFGYRRGGEVPGADDARTRRRSSESLARRATEGAAALLRGSATPPAASTGPCRRVASGLGTSLAPRPLTHRAGHGDHGGGRGWGPRDHRSRPGRRLQPTSWASFGAQAERSAPAECEPERGPAGPVPSPRGGRAAGVDEQQADE